MKYLIVLNALSFNRGSEALVRGLVKIINNSDKNAKIVISAGNSGEAQPNMEGVTEIVPRIAYKKFIGRLTKITDNTLIPNNVLYWIQCKDLIREVAHTDVVLVIGADNYDVNYHMGKSMNVINSLVFSTARGKVFLIDCSFDVKDLSLNVVKDISRFPIITVRETKSYENAKTKFDQSKIRLYPDPAFVMNPAECDLPDGFEEGNTIGINLSGLVTSLSNQDLIFENYVKLIEFILTDEKSKVLLLPHVMNGADFNTLKTVYNRCLENKLDAERIILWKNDSYNSEQIKYVISKLRFLITARTHASIAAYSTCVPTLVLGYSIKSIGIAYDLFATANGYVVNYNEIKTDKDLTNAFIWLKENETVIKNRLKMIMPEYQQMAYQMGCQLICEGTK